MLSHRQTQPHLHFNWRCHSANRQTQPYPQFTWRCHSAKRRQTQPHPQLRWRCHTVSRRQTQPYPQFRWRCDSVTQADTTTPTIQVTLSQCHTGRHNHTHNSSDAVTVQTCRHNHTHNSGDAITHCKKETDTSTPTFRCTARSTHCVNRRQTQVQVYSQEYSQVCARATCPSQPAASSRTSRWGAPFILHAEHLMIIVCHCASLPGLIILFCTNLFQVSRVCHSVRLAILLCYYYNIKYKYFTVTAYIYVSREWEFLVAFIMQSKIWWCCYITEIIPHSHSHSHTGGSSTHNYLTLVGVLHLIIPHISGWCASDNPSHWWVVCTW